jgi:hypothetical protein
MDRNELPFHPRHTRVPSGVSKTIAMPMVRSAQPCTYIMTTLTLSPNGPKRVPLDPRHVGVPPCAAQNDFRANATFGANCKPILH